MGDDRPTAYDQDLLEWLQYALTKVDAREDRDWPWRVEQEHRVLDAQGSPVTVAFRPEHAQLITLARNALPGIVATGRQLLELANQFRGPYEPAVDRALRCIAEAVAPFCLGYRQEWAPGSWEPTGSGDEVVVGSWTWGGR